MKPKPQSIRWARICLYVNSAPAEVRQDFLWSVKRLKRLWNNKKSTYRGVENKCHESGSSGDISEQVMKKALGDWVIGNQRVIELLKSHFPQKRIAGKQGQKVLFESTAAPVAGEGADGDQAQPGQDTEAGTPPLSANPPSAATTPLPSTGPSKTTPASSAKKCTSAEKFSPQALHSMLGELITEHAAARESLAARAAHDSSDDSTVRKNALRRLRLIFDFT